MGYETKSQVETKTQVKAVLPRSGHVLPATYEGVANPFYIGVAFSVDQLTSPPMTPQVFILLKTSKVIFGCYSAHHPLTVNAIALETIASRCISRGDTI